MKGRRLVAGAAGFALLLGLSTAPPVQMTESAWVDSEHAAATVSAMTIPAPVASCGLLGLGSVRVSWTAVPGATGYIVHYGSGAGTSASVGASVTTRNLTGIVTGGTFQVQAVRNFGSTTWTSLRSNALSYTILLGLVGTCA
jgi:hypothetical protein